MLCLLRSEMMFSEKKRCELTVLAAAVLLLGCMPVRGSECVISDGHVPQDCLSHPSEQQLVTAKVPLDLRVQWRHVSILRPL